MQNMIFKKFQSFKFAFNGILLGFKEKNFVLQTVIAFLAIGLGIYFKISVYEWISILICCSTVLSLELINTSIEHTINLITKEQNKNVGKIKDIAAGAVLMSSIFSLIIGIIIFAPKIYSIIH